MMHGTHCQQGRDGHVLSIDITVGQDDIVISLIYALLCLMTQGLKRIAQTVAAFRSVKKYR